MLGTPDLRTKKHRHKNAFTTTCARPQGRRLPRLPSRGAAVHINYAGITLTATQPSTQPRLLTMDQPKPSRPWLSILMPREQPNYPTDGAPVTGTAISHFSAVQANGAVSTWDKTAELYWTLSGNVPLGVDSTVPAPPHGANDAYLSVHHD